MDFLTNSRNCFPEQLHSFYNENIKKTLKQKKTQPKHSNPLVPTAKSINIDVYITTLPTEVLTVIFKFIDPVSSACAGVTCKRFYTVHFSLNPRVWLHRYFVNYNRPLWKELQAWVGEDFHFCPRDGKFFSAETEEERMCLCWTCCERRGEVEAWDRMCVC